MLRTDWAFLLKGQLKASPKPAKTHECDVCHFKFINKGALVQHKKFSHPHWKAKNVPVLTSIKSIPKEIVENEMFDFCKSIINECISNINIDQPKKIVEEVKIIVKVPPPFFFNFFKKYWISFVIKYI